MKGMPRQRVYPADDEPLPQEIIRQQMLERECVALRQRVRSLEASLKVAAKVLLPYANGKR
jgi:hypothetical protein